MEVYRERGCGGGRVDKKLLCASGNFTVQTEVGASPTAAWRDASRWLCGCSVSADGQSKQLSGLGSAAAIREANERAEDGRPAVASRPDSANLRTFLHGQESVERPWTMARLDTLSAGRRSRTPILPSQRWKADVKLKSNLSHFRSNTHLCTGNRYILTMPCFM